MELKKKIDKAIKDYDLYNEIKQHNDIIERYKSGELDLEYGDESGDYAFWDEAGYLATKGVDFGEHAKWDEAIAKQDVIYYGFMRICGDILTKTNKNGK